MTITPRELAEAAARVRRAITVDACETSSHRVALVEGLEAPGVTASLAVYLVGAGFARAVSTSLRIAAAFLPTTPEAEDQIRRAVVAVIGQNNQVPVSFKTDQRNPWIAEGIAHLILWLSRRTVALSPRGRLHALSPLHVGAKEQGIDLSALFSDELDLGITIGEAKASRLNATSNVAEAAAFFGSIDDGDPIREIQLRDRVQLLRQALADHLAQRVTAALWEENRCYLPFVAYGANDSPFSPRRGRSSYRGLTPGYERVLLVCLGLADYEQFFDTLADSMRGV
jgi:hypothetical protein